MPPKVALLLTLGFMFYLFRRDIREKPNVTGALWLPILWMFLVASRPVSFWLSILGLPGFAATSVEEGSPLDALVFLALIVLGIAILNRRGVNGARFIADNPWLALFLFYCFLAIFWSDFPIVSFKRWIKILGHPIMVMVFLSEPDPREALVRIMKRCAYVVFPISILWLKYFPKLGRTASDWGAMGNCGITVGKNQLGAISFIFGLFFLWHFFLTWRMEKGTARRNELRLTGFLLWMTGYGLFQAHSATSDICLILGAVILAFFGLASSTRRGVIGYALVGVAILLFAQIFFDIYGTVIGLSGHEATLESRGLLWQTLLQMDTSPFFGTGFESFWLEDRIRNLWAMNEFAYHPTQAHNGYLELYLNLGVVGLLIFAGVICAICRKVVCDLRQDLQWGLFEMACFGGILIHSWTEADFKGLSFPFLFFFVIAVKRGSSRVDFALIADVNNKGVDHQYQTELSYG